jgi:hypothetical protein
VPTSKATAATPAMITASTATRHMQGQPQQRVYPSSPVYPPSPSWENAHLPPQVT